MDAENAIDRTYKQQGSLKENGNSKETYLLIIRNKQIKFLVFMMKKEQLENLTFTRQTEDKKIRKKQHVN